MRALTDERAEEAMQYLSDTDEPCARLKADMERFEWKAKAQRQTIFKLTEGTVADRNAAADTHPEVAACMDVYFITLGSYQHMANKRATEAIVLDTWRTICANRRRG
jgi:branched-subunit amino acid aminotransferase/4-amino-4-deoxychorismate lyase